MAAAGRVAAYPGAGAMPTWKGHAVAPKQRRVDIAEHGSPLDGEGRPTTVEIDLVHEREINDRLHRTVVHEIGVAMAAATHRDALTGLDRRCDGRSDLFGRSGQIYGHWISDPTPVERGYQLRETRVVRTNRHRPEGWDLLLTII